MDTKKVLVCGATGFIGRNTTEKLAQRPDLEVYGTYNNRPRYDNDNVNWVKADLTNKEDVNNVCKGMDVVIQMAASTTGVKDSINAPHIHLADNAIMNTLLLRSAYDNNVGQFIFPSCTVVYPSSDQLIKETDFTGEIHPKYFGGAWMKIYAEKTAEFYAGLGKTKHTVFRHSNVYGPYDKYDLEKSHVFGATIAKIMTAKDNDKIVVWGKGLEERDLLHVDDLVSFMQTAIDTQSTPYELVNVGLGESISVDGLVKKVIKHSNKSLDIEYDETKPNVMTKVALDCSKAKQVFGWTPKITLDEGIKKTIKWYEENLL
ncbi:NAD-dependent epimerase/dehydratase family protein [Candidatus Pacearchaeota archaeon]|nr:NAD-dependent epimerase/dehydratase family protein [Candidatus Pacearchaeota archaeon]